MNGKWDELLGDDTTSVTTEMLKGIPRVQSPLLPYQYQHEEYFICPKQPQTGWQDCGLHFLQGKETLAVDASAYWISPGLLMSRLVDFVD